MIIWMGGMGWMVARIARMRGNLNKALCHAATLDDPRWSDSLAALSAAMGLSRPPCLVTIEGGASPFVCGVIRPTLVLPRPLLAPLSAERWRAVILHELAHLKRGDLIWAWLPELARIILWFHPVSHWVARWARLERELACDGLAMTLAEVDVSGYAQILVDVLSLSAPCAGASSGDGRPRPARCDRSHLTFPHRSPPSRRSAAGASPMNSDFGPWSTSLGPGWTHSLSTFWKHRMVRLSEARARAGRLTRRDWLRIGAGGASLALIPTLCTGLRDRNGRPARGAGAEVA